MPIAITIIYAFRDRDVNRVSLSLASLKRQKTQNFEVLFIDYGSQDVYANAAKKTVKEFLFANYHYIAHQGVLWNKSKALNYGIKKAKGAYVFIADVDIVFHTEATGLLSTLGNLETSFLFSLHYLSKDISQNATKITPFDALKSTHKGLVNGMVLASKVALECVHGYDEFFHFYGSEDVDLYQRLEHAGQTVKMHEGVYFKHLWHPIYNNYDDSKMSLVPRLYNVKRINEQHYFYNKSQHLKVPRNQVVWGLVVSKKALQLLENPKVTIEIPSTHAHVVHFLEVSLKYYKNTTLRVTFFEDPDVGTLKYWLKLMFKKQSKPYVSIKKINDLILTKIVNEYRDYNYSYNIALGFKRLTFTIQLND